MQTIGATSEHRLKRTLLLGVGLLLSLRSSPESDGNIHIELLSSVARSDVNCHTVQHRHGERGYCARVRVERKLPG